jgi:hypothetical protein
MVILKMGSCMGVLAASALYALLSGACVVPDPGPEDTLPAASPVLPPPITVNYRHLDVNPVTDSSLYPDSELIDLYMPRAVGEDTGVLLWVHGGGWTMGDRTGIPAWVLQQVPRGYLVASIGYRLAFYDANGVAQNNRKGGGTLPRAPTMMAMAVVIPRGMALAAATFTPVRLQDVGDPEGGARPTRPISTTARRSTSSTGRSGRSSSAMAITTRG